MTDERKELSEQISGRVFQGQEITANVEKALLDNVKVHGKTLREWSNTLFVDIKLDPTEDDDTTARTLAKYSARIGKNIQIAEGLLGIFEMQASAVNNYKDKEFAKQYVLELENTGGKRISAEKLRYLVSANNDIDKNEMAAQTASLIRDYFKRIVKGLEEARKSIENQIALNRQRLWILNRNS